MPSTHQSPFLAPAQSSSKVNVSLYVMSRCGDSRLCEGIFEDVIQTKGILDKIDLHVGYVAHLNASAPLGIDCLHGELECIGNAHQICLQEHLDTATFYANIACQNYENFPGDIGKLALTRRCAETNKVDWWKSGVGQCIQGKKAEHDDGKKAAEKGKVGKEARRLLLDNVKNTLARGEKSTCVIEIATSKKQQRRRCKVDHGVWTGCDDGHTATDFVRVIEEEWEALQ